MTKWPLIDHAASTWHHGDDNNMAGIEICEPSTLYNILTQVHGPAKPALLNDTHLLLLDTRPRGDYNESHITAAKFTVQEKDNDYAPPLYGAEVPTLRHIIVYDSNTVSVVESTPAVKCAKVLAAKGSKHPVKVLKGGFERFSAEYPFLRTQKIMYTQMELEKLPRYPSELLPLSLYLGDCTHAYNAALNHAMKISVHVNAATQLYPAFPGSITTLHVGVRDEEEEDLLGRFEEVCDFIDLHVKQSERVLVYGEQGISRAAVFCIAYLMKRNKWTLQEAYEHTQRCRPQVQPLRSFVVQLSRWEETLMGQTHTDISEPSY